MSQIARWLDRAAAEVEAAVPLLNASNLFPVADGDTGTNLLVTLKAAAIGARAGEMAGASRAALEEAVGNSGVILSEILRGISQGLPHGWAAAWIRANEVAHSAVINPAPGTMLTVSAAIARRATEVGSHSADAELLHELWQAARAAALESASHPPIPEAAGTVDAGAYGLERVIGALAAVTNDIDCEPLPVSMPSRVVQQPSMAAVNAIGMTEVMYLLEGCSAENAELLRQTLHGLGDSVLVVGSEDLWNVHVHCIDTAAAIEAGIAHGRPKKIRITPLNAAPISPRCIIVVSNGPGLTQLLTQSGAQVIDAFDRRPDGTEFVVAAADAREAILMPHSRSSALAAAGAIEPLRQAGVRVSVLPTRSPVQVLAALAVHDDQLSFDDDLVAMTAASGQTRYATIAVAKRDALTSVGPCKTGNILGLIGGDVLVIGSDVEQVARDVVMRFVATGGELLTLIRGQGVSSALTSGLIAEVRSNYPAIEVQDIDGGQLHYPLLIGLE